MNNQNDHDMYIIPPNFVDTGTFFGGLFKARNVIEAGILGIATGLPVLLFLPFGLTTRIIVLCLTALPLMLVALIGISWESLSAFLLIFLKYLKNRRVVGGEENLEDNSVPKKERKIRKKSDRQVAEDKKSKPRTEKIKAPKQSRKSQQPRHAKKTFRRGSDDFPAEFDEVRGYEIRQKLRPAKKQQP